MRQRFSPLVIVAALIALAPVFAAQIPRTLGTTSLPSAASPSPARIGGSGHRLEIEQGGVRPPVIVVRGNPYVQVDLAALDADDVGVPDFTP